MLTVAAEVAAGSSSVTWAEEPRFPVLSRQDEVLLEVGFVLHLLAKLSHLCPQSSGHMTGCNRMKIRLVDGKTSMPLPVCQASFVFIGQKEIQMAIQSQDGNDRIAVI